MGGLLIDAMVEEVLFVAEACSSFPSTSAWLNVFHVPFLCLLVVLEVVVVGLAGFLLLAMLDGVQLIHHLLQLPSPPIVWGLLPEELYLSRLYSNQLVVLR
jgi:hypothetical protein